MEQLDADRHVNHRGRVRHAQLTRQEGEGWPDALASSRQNRREHWPQQRVLGPCGHTQLRLDLFEFGSYQPEERASRGHRAPSSTPGATSPNSAAATAVVWRASSGKGSSRTAATWRAVSAM